VGAAEVGDGLEVGEVFKTASHASEELDFAVYGFDQAAGDARLDDDEDSLPVGFHGLGKLQKELDLDRLAH
jgi:CobQ-like glutamine amidotransferase family enzyme